MNAITNEAKPATLAPRFEEFPDELTRLHQWVLWRLAQRADGKWTKKPLRVDGRHADSTDPATWAPFEDVMTVYGSSGYDGVGFVLSREDPFVGIDLDHVIDATGAVHPEALRIVGAINSYTERSPSGRGLRIIARGTLPDGWRNTKKYVIEIEMYDSARFLTITGHRFEGTRR